MMVESGGVEEKAAERKAQPLDNTIGVSKLMSLLVTRNLDS